MADERLPDRIARLERERDDADRDYNQALTGVDRATLTRPDLPHPPPPYDETMLGAINSAWDILPSGAPPIDGSVKGRLRGFVWRLIGPALETHALPAGIVFSALPSALRVRFGTTGTADNATVVLASGPRSRRVVVNQRGRVQIQ